jgi:tetratricopeptide (TPR) repeat protein
MRSVSCSLALVLATACHRQKPVAPLPPLAHAAYAHYLEGKLAGYRDDWAGAVEALADATSAAPDQPVVAVELARAQHKAKRDDAARATLATARTRWPKHAQVWIASGDLLASTEPAEAIRAYRRAIDLEPLEERAYLGLAKLEQPPGALATLRRLIARIPASIEGHYRLGLRLAANGDLAATIRELRNVLELDPDHIDARLDLSRALRKQGKLVEAIAQTRSAFDRSGQALDLAEELFYLLLEADDGTAAIDLLTLLDDDRSDPEALATIARLDRSLGRLDEARAIATRISKLDADLGVIVLAEIEVAGGEPAAAARRALGVAETSEHFVGARRIAAAAWLAAGEPQRALEALAPARARKPDDIELATSAAFALADLGKLADARALLVPLGDGPEATFARARLADHAGDVTTALATIQPLADAKPDLVPAQNLAGYLLADAGHQLVPAERYLRRARALAPGDPAVLDSWGWLLYRKGLHREAVRVLDRAARYAPREPEILVHLAAAWIADGAPRTGLAILDRAAALHPAAAVARRIEAVRRTVPAAPDPDPRRP